MATEAGKNPGNQIGDDIAIAALSFIATDAELLPRFLDLTGIDAGSIRQAAAEPGFMAGVLDFLLAHEPTLHRFCQESGIAPEAVVKARRSMGGLDESQYI